MYRLDSPLLESRFDRTPWKITGNLDLTSLLFRTVISAMTEVTDIKGGLPEAVRRFVLEWGNLGERWGVNRSVSQIHALLYASKQPLSAEEIADTLGIARSNVSNSLKELQSWNIIRSVPILGDRRTFYTAETDLWNLMARIAAGRKARELDPAAEALRECVEMSRDDETVEPVVQLRLREMLDFVERTSRWYDQMIALPRSTMITLMKLGGGVARLIDRSGRKSRD
jgi:DNA-binding transcriptional regulator GbsR (MarR family)